MNLDRGQFIRVIIALTVAVLVGLFLANFVKTTLRTGQSTGTVTQPLRTNSVPVLNTEEIVSGLTNPWDIAVTPNEIILFTERSGTISAVIDGQKQSILTVPNVFARGEGGLLGLTIDPDFEQNRFVYACYNTPQDVRVSRWVLSLDNTRLTDQVDIITGIASNTDNSPGRHSGCRPRFSPQNHLYVGTGDAAIASNPQNSQSLAGKILRVDRDGNPVEGNLSQPYDPRIFSYGHRNVQGLAFAPQVNDTEAVGYSVEHGPNIDDEVNPIQQGNFGWDPGPGYDESVAMTDTDTFPEAVSAAWSSGTPTIAPSGAAIINGRSWGSYDGLLAVAVLKDRHIRLFDFTNQNVRSTELFPGEYGRIRSVVMGVGESMYFSTDNGNGSDVIVRVTPQLRDN